MRYRGGLVACIAIVVACCGSGSPDALVGEYAIQANGPPEVKVTKMKGRYLVSIRQGREWIPFKDVSPCDDKDYADFFGSDWKDIQPVGLCPTSGAFVIFKVKRGARVGGRTHQTGYFFVYMGGVVDIYRL
jgi:hypothetical protein